MKEHNDDPKLQQLLHEKLEEHTIPAPDFIWPAIEKELFPPARKRRPFFWWFVFSGLFLGTLSFLFLFPANHIDFSFVGAPVSMSNSMKSLQTIDSTASGNEVKSNMTASNSSHHTQAASSGFGTENNRSLFNSAQQHQISTTSKGRSNKHRNPDGNEQAMQTNPGLTPVAISTKYFTSIAGSVIAKIAESNQLTDSVLTAENFRNNENELAFSLLLAKSIEYSTDTIRLIHPEKPFPKLFFPYSFIDVYAGAGRNNRSYSGIVESNSKAFIIDRTIPLRNRNFGLDYNYQFLPFASFRIGINHGSNRYTTRLFPIRIANTALNDELELSSPSGELKSAPLDLADQASPISDTTTFLMRIVHRSQYISIPLSIRFNTANLHGPQVYGYTGFDFVFRGNDKNILIVRKSFTERSFSTSKPREARGFYPGWHLGLGIASNPVRKLQFYGEFNYSQVFGNYYTGKVITIRSNNVQMNVGLRIKL